MRNSLVRFLSAVLLTAALLLCVCASGCFSGPVFPDLSSEPPSSGPESSPPERSEADPSAESEAQSPDPQPADPSGPEESSEEPPEEPSEETGDLEEGSVLYRSLSLPESSGSNSSLLASQLLGFCSGGTEDVTSYVMEQAGFSVVLSSGYDKSPTDASHTCAFMVGEGTILYRGEIRPVFLIAVRGTSGAEWDSNFDFAPSHSDQTMYAENFLACAEDVLEKTNKILASRENPLIAVCGHSRGAACANLLGVLLNKSFPKENTFVYTYATPTTVRESAGFDNSPHVNIFNYINPCDIVTKVPLKAWGFGRAGKDVVLDADADKAAKIEASANAIGALAPSISAYYEDRHPLSGKGKDGPTAYEVMTKLGTLFVTMGTLPDELSKLDENSFYYPLIAFFVGDGGSGISLTVLMEHMPAQYMLKIKSLPESVG